MKKIFSIMLMMIFVCMSALVVVNADAENGKLVLNAPEYAKSGEEFQVTVSLENNPGIITLNVNLDYDSNAVELVAVEDAELLVGYTEPEIDAKPNPVTLRWSNGTASKNNTKNGLILTLTFKALENLDDVDATFALNFSGDKNIVLAKDENADKTADPITLPNFDVDTATVKIVDEIPAPETDPVTDPATDPVTDPVTDNETVDTADTDVDTDADTKAPDTTDGGKTPQTGDTLVVVSIASLIVIAAGAVVLGKKRSK